MMGERCLFHADGRHRTAVHSLLAIASIAGTGIGDPRLIVAKLKDLWAKLATKSTANTGIHVDLRGCHDHSSFLEPHIIDIDLLLR
jgi:hypothetical protein